MVESLHVDRYGNTIPVEVTLRKVASANQEMFLFVVRNIIERKQAEDALRRAHDELEERVAERTVELATALNDLREKESLLIQQSRTAAMGEMINNIAHQWRQPLNTLGLTVQQLQLLSELGELEQHVVDKAVEDSMRMIQHMSRTIDDFRNFFRPDKEQVEFDVGDAVMNAITLVDAGFKNSHIRLSCSGGAPSAIRGFPNEFSQVVINILSNAREELTGRCIPDPVVEIHISQEGGKTLVSIEDNAGGMPEDVLMRVFDPHFTTKGPQGTGIGLFMAKTIIERNMNGKLTAGNTAKGARFTIEI